MTITRTTIGEYVLRVAGARGRVMHLVHRGELATASPVAGCGLGRSDWSEIGESDSHRRPLCLTCAQHANDRGVSGGELYPETAQ